MQSIWTRLKAQFHGQAAREVVHVDLKAPAHAAAEETASVAGVRVLLIEQDDGTRDLLATSLRAYGADVVAVDSFREAIAALPRSRPGVVVSNCTTDDGEAPTLIRLVRSMEAERRHRIPTIAVTGSAQVAAVMQPATIGFQLRVPRSIDPRRLVSLIGRVATSAATA